jgi:hypothetical protein
MTTLGNPLEKLRLQAESDLVTDGDITRAIKGTLRKAFPGTGFSVRTSGHQIAIKWTDDGPSVEQVQDALIGAGAEAKPDWRGERQVRLHWGSIWFHRYNAGERAAEHEDRARRAQEAEAQRQREGSAVRAAEQAKHGAMCAHAKSPAARVPTALACDTEAHAAFEALRQRAETDVATDAERQHRPSWAPPLILEGELREVCVALGWLTEDDKPIARLWAGFADPKATGRILREQRGRHPLSGITCRGFELHAGSERGPTGAILFEAQRTASGQWRFGPCLYANDYYSPRQSEWEQLVRERERYREVPELGADVARISERIAAIDAEDSAAAQAHHHRQHLRARAVALAKARVLDFAGAPGLQMQLAGRLCGQCFHCFRALTDPISLERGIGPDCLENKVAWIKSQGSKGDDVRAIAFWSGMPVDFVTAILDQRDRGG